MTNATQIENPTHAVYVCTNKRCPAHSKEWRGALPSHSRVSTGTAVTCSRCGRVAFMRRMEKTTESAAQAADAAAEE